MDGRNGITGLANSWAGRTVAITVLLAAAAAGLAVGRFGSLRAMSASLRGHSLVTDAKYRIGEPTGRAGEWRITFRLQNLGPRPIRVTGSSSSCSCAAGDERPDVIPVSGDAPLGLIVRPKGDLRGLHELVRVFTDDPASPVLLFEIGGTIGADGEPLPMATWVREVTGGRPR